MKNGTATGNDHIHIKTLKAVPTSLQEQGLEDVYIELLMEMYTNTSMTVHLHKESNKINIRRGVRQARKHGHSPPKQRKS